MRKAILVAMVLLAGCDGEEKKSDLVPLEERNRRTAIPLEPQAILFPDIEKHELYGPNCAFAPEGGGVGAIVIARKEDGYLKLRGEVVRYAADSGSRELAEGVRSRFTGKEHTFVLKLDDEAGTGGKGRMTVTDLHEVPVYDARGDVQCNG